MKQINKNAIPAEMRQLQQWVLWKQEIREGKPTKVPYQLDGKTKAKSNDPSTWGTFEDAIAAMSKADGIGFVTTPECGIVLLDLDHCLADGEPESWAKNILAVANSYTELSPSGNGYHVYFRGKLPGPGKKYGDAEIYDRARYFTVTGNQDPVFNAPFRELSDQETATVYALVLGRGPNKEAIEQSATKQDAPGNDLIEKMFSSKNGAAIRALFNGDTSAYSEDQSAADLALCGHLAFWTGRDMAEMDRLFRQSGLMREKWDKCHSSDGRTYGQMTLEKALEACKEIYKPADVGAVQAIADPWPLETLRIDDLLSTEPEPFDYIIPGLLTKGICGVLYGEGGASKSLAALWLGIQLATAEIWPALWLGKFQIEKARRVLYVSLEDLRIDIHNRLAPIVRACLNPKDFAMPDKGRFNRALAENLLLLGREQVFADDPDTLLDEKAKPTGKFSRLLATIENVRPDLVLLDTWSKSSRADENDNILQAQDAACWTYLRDKTGATIILLAHANKWGRNDKKAGQSALRGASSRTDELRWALWFRPIGCNPAGKALIEVNHVKSTRCKTHPPFTVILDYPVYNLAENETVDDTIIQQVLEFVKAHPGCTQRAAREKLKKKHATISTAFKDAIDEEKIIKKCGGYHVKE